MFKTGNYITYKTHHVDPNSYMPVFETKKKSNVIQSFFNRTNFSNYLFNKVLNDITNNYRLELARRILENKSLYKHYKQTSFLKLLKAMTSQNKERTIRELLESNNNGRNFFLGLRIDNKIGYILSSKLKNDTKHDLVVKLLKDPTTGHALINKLLETNQGRSILVNFFNNDQNNKLIHKILIEPVTKRNELFVNLFKILDDAGKKRLIDELVKTEFINKIEKSNLFVKLFNSYNKNSIISIISSLSSNSKRIFKEQIELRNNSINLPNNLKSQPKPPPPPFIYKNENPHFSYIKSHPYEGAGINPTKPKANIIKQINSLPRNSLRNASSKLLSNLQQQIKNNPNLKEYYRKKVLALI